MPFEHYHTYDLNKRGLKKLPGQPANQTATIVGNQIAFTRDETIFMDIFQKYSLEEIWELAHSSGFEPVYSCSDPKDWFMDTFWAAVLRLDFLN
ncbi:L-histidine N(alpha)-methyltransferase [Sabulibacter ruber]|uniref:L-histidine N(alpha)-methyltransferase n=1 Tax=Sabulibacter ruber TaxID=2811901 RepID=UPI003100D870